MKRVFKILVIIAITLLLSFISFLSYITINDYKPNEISCIYNNKNFEIIEDSLELDLLIWNIGYAGLSKEMDFFYDGGKNVYPKKEIVKQNLIGILDNLKKYKPTDFILLQEVDRASKRSYFFNQYDSIAKLFENHYSYFAKNYDVAFVPVPLSKPMGKVNSGLMTLSKYPAKKVDRHSFIGNYSWPKSLFLLDRCFMVSRFQLENNDELVVINTHNSAYDDGSLKQAQMEQLKEFLIDEYNKGNYVIVGGDWNQSPPNFVDNFGKDIMDNEVRTDISDDYLAGWQWVYRNNIPTNRRVTTEYIQGKSLTTVIDFYLISPNISLVEVENYNLGFTFSDHQPVYMKVKLY